MNHTNPLHAAAHLNQRSLSILARAILLARGQFALILARCNYEQLQQRMARDLQQELAHQSEDRANLSEIFLPPSTTTLFTRLLVAVEGESSQQQEFEGTIQNAIDSQTAAMMVFGLGSVSDLDRVLAATNQSREEFRLAFPFPIVLWTTDEVLQKLTRFAPDFKSWASAALKFDLALDEAIALWWEESARLFEQLLAAGADSFITNAELKLAPANRRRRELEFARSELLDTQGDSFPAIEAIRAFLLGRDAYGDRDFEVALQFYEKSLDFWLQGPEFWDLNPLEKQDFSQPIPRLFHPFCEQRGLLWYHIGLCHCHRARLYPARSRQCWLQARSCFSAAIKIFTEKNRPTWSYRLTVQLGQILQHLEAWDELQALARHSLTSTEATIRDRARAYGFLARAFLARSQFKPAKSLSRKALALHQRAPQSGPVRERATPQAEAFYCLLLAKAHSSLGETNCALDCLERARKLLAPLMSDLTADSLDPLVEKETIDIEVLEILRSLYFQRQQYELAFELKQEQHAIEQACGLKAFYGVSPLAYEGERSPSRSIAEGGTRSDRQEILASGRQQDVEKLLERLRRSEHKLTIVHGASGVGKSSLLHAGLVPALWNETIVARHVLPVLQTTYQDWQQGLGRALARSLHRYSLKTASSTDAPIFFTRETILEYLQHNAGNNWLPVLIFDQFEEFFFHCPHSSERREFYQFLCEVLSIPFVKIILCLREDELHELLTMEREMDWGAIDNDLLDRQMRYALEDLDPQVARRTIEVLAARSRFPLEEALIERLVRDMAGSQGSVRPIELQVVGGALQAEKITTLCAYEQLGDDPKMVLVERWLQAAIADCGPENEEAVWQVLFALTDTKGLRPLKTKAELLCFNPGRVGSSNGDSEIAREPLDLILKILTGSGLVYCLREETENRYQLVHAYLVQRIRSSYGDRTSNAIATQLRSSKVELVRVRQQRLQALAIGGVCAFLALIAVSSSIQTEIQRRLALVVSLNAELMALSSSSEALFASNQQFEALLEALRAANKLERAEETFPSLPFRSLWPMRSQQRNVVKTETRLKVTSILERAIYGTLERNRFEGHSDVVWGASFSPDGQRIATASLDKTVKVWALDGRLVATLFGHTDSVTSVDIAPDLAMVSSSWDGTVRLWRADGKPERVLRVGKGRLYSAGFSPDGRRVLAAGADGIVRIWSRDGQLEATLRGHRGDANWATFSPDGQLVATVGKDRSLRLWTGGGKVLRVVAAHREPVNYVAFSPKGDTIATASDDGTVKLWSRDGQLLATFSGHSGSVHAVGFSPDGSQVVSASDDNTIALWDRSGKRLRTLKGHSDRVTGASFGPGGSTLVSSSFDKTVKVWALDGRERTVLRGHRDRLQDIAFSPDGRLVATASKDKTVKVWTRRGRLKATLEGHRDGVFAVSFSPDGRLLATASRDHTIKLWNCQGKLLGTLEGHSDWVIDVQWSPDSQSLASASRDHTVKLWSRQGVLLQTLKGHGDRVNAVAFSRDNGLLVSASDDKTAKLWQRLEEGSFGSEPLATLKGHSNWVLDVSFLPEASTRRDRPLLATASYDNTVKFWNRSGKAVSTLKGHTDSIADLSFNPTGELLATATWSNQIQLWRFDDTLLETLDGHRDRVTSVSWSPDGKALATASDDRTAILWTLDTEQLTTMACDWLRDYIRHSHKVRKSDRALCLQ
ncbi:MAG: hypothetical protein SW833_07655 [Cyanobacteriota bacterium]|nr:hypothetical protein [Cyanobacteriota bacterium]